MSLLITCTAFGASTASETGSGISPENQAVVIDLCSAGEADPVIHDEVFLTGEAVECTATGSITLGPVVTFEKDSAALLQAPVIRILEDVLFEEGSAFAARNVFNAQVPKTGQVSCYGETGWSEDCTGTGQDGELQEGVAWPDPRFTINGDGTVTDNLTNLVWMENPECLGRFAYPNTTWSDAIDAANTMADGQCGLSDGSSAGDWRIPNIDELVSLFNFEFTGPALPNTSGTGQWADGDPFSGIHGILQGAPSTYWSSTAYSDRTNLLFCATAYDGYILLCGVDTFQYVWMVRGKAVASTPAPVPRTGQTHSIRSGDDGSLRKGVVWPQPRFRDNLNGTVTDYLTGLIWLRDANCFGSATTWVNALNQVKSLEHGKCGVADYSRPGDWRLPNILELLSLVHHNYDDLALPDTGGTGQWEQGMPFYDVQPNTY